MEAEPLADKKSECAAMAGGMADDGAQRQEKPRKRIRKKVSDPEKERLFLSAMSRILQVTGVETQASLADVLGVQQSSISDAKRRNSIPAQWYMTLLTKRGINPAWVVSGVGPRHVLGPCAELGTHRQADAASARTGEGTDATEGAPASPVLVRVYSTRCRSWRRKPRPRCLWPGNWRCRAAGRPRR